MKKITKILSRVLCLAPIAAVLSIASCSTVEETSEYDNWQVRNQLKVDSIASVCANNAEGNWEKILSFDLDEDIENQNPNNNHYVYVQKLENGTGTYHPLYNDSVRVHYMGRLIPSVSYPQGYIFDKSYTTYVSNEETDVPTIMSVGGTKTGFATALMHMVEGDHWKVYIPYYLAYGESTSGSIPGYSMLIFDIKLAKIYKYGIDTETTWH